MWGGGEGGRRGGGPQAQRGGGGRLQYENAQMCVLGQGSTLSILKVPLHTS